MNHIWETDKAVGCSNLLIKIGEKRLRNLFIVE